MTTKLAVLLAVLLGGFSTVFLLPQQLGYQPVGVKRELPHDLAGWLAREGVVTEQEREVLVGSDIMRNTYVNGRGDQVQVSIILAGQDMMTGIHRPERCLQAQGWTTESSSHRVITTSDQKLLPVTRLRNSRQVVWQGKTFPVGDVADYWFIGYTRQAATHWDRVVADSVDRVLKGYNQRWAMVMVSAEITKGVQRDGRDEAETDRNLEQVISRLAPKITAETVMR